jgi:hypothetical protein
MLLHAAEGELYEQAVAEGTERAGLALTTLTLKSLAANTALDTALVAAGRSLGPPWQKDHRLAAAVALAALAGRT